MKRMKLVITEVVNRPAFVKAIGDIYYTLSFRERVDMCDKLPFQDEDMYMAEEELKNKLGTSAIYTYQIAASNDLYAPPWEQQDYIDARAWYNTLPEEDRKKIDTLVRGSMPWA
jgi:hypothetical protein